MISYTFCVAFLYACLFTYACLGEERERETECERESLSERESRGNDLYLFFYLLKLVLCFSICLSPSVCKCRWMDFYDEVILSVCQVLHSIDIITLMQSRVRDRKGFCPTRNPRPLLNIPVYCLTLVCLNFCKVHR